MIKGEIPKCKIFKLRCDNSLYIENIFSFYRTGFLNSKTIEGGGRTTFPPINLYFIHIEKFTEYLYFIETGLFSENYPFKSFVEHICRCYF